MEPSTWQTYLVTQERQSAGRDTERIVADAIVGGVDVIQLREKGMAARRRYQLGVQLREQTDAAGVPLIVNDRIDLAKAIAADGVHLGQSDLPIGIARDQLGPEAIVGCSASTVADARAAVAAGADYLGVGAVFQTDSKDLPDEEHAIGTERVRAIVDAVDVPVIGIGGIDADNAASIINAGATGVAVISAITAAEDPRAATRTLSEVISHAN